MTEFELNGRAVSTDADVAMPLLWWLRDIQGLTGSKYGCGIGACGACTVHVDGEPVRACLTPLGTLQGHRVLTVEGLVQTDSAGTAGAVALHAVQQAWIDHDVAQCGYCQAGQIMSAAALLARNPRPDEAAIDAAMAGNICRCGTYPRIRAALRALATGDA